MWIVLQLFSQSRYVVVLTQLGSFPRMSIEMYAAITGISEINEKELNVRER